MRYVSPEGRLAGPEAAFDSILNRRAMAWDRARGALGGGRIWSVALVLLLTFTVARSTSTVQWVSGIDVVNVIAVGAAVLMAVLALTLALLLCTTYAASSAIATRANVKPTGGARWDCWEGGLVAMAALIVVGILLPPLSTADKTLDLESGIFSNWAQLQDRLSHPGILGGGRGTGVTGFTDEVKLSGPLQRTKDAVFTYTIVGTYASKARYFRGLNITQQANGVWRYPRVNGTQQFIAKNAVPDYAEQYQKLGLATIDVRMLHPPADFRDVLFYPGELYRTDRPTEATQVPLRAVPQSNNLYTVDHLRTVNPTTSAGSYAVTVDYSTATLTDLESAGTAYPDWLAKSQYTTTPETCYRSQTVLAKIHELALKIGTAASAKNPYDAASAIE